MTTLLKYYSANHYFTIERVIFEVDFHQNISRIKFRGFLISYHVIQFKGVYFMIMWSKVAIFHAERHTLLIQSLQQGIFCVFNFLVAVLLVSCGQPLFPCLPCGPQEKGADYARPARPLFRAERLSF